MNIIHYVCGKYPYDIGGVARFDSILEQLYPKRIFFKAPEEAHKLYEYCLVNSRNTLVITDNQHAWDVPQNIPCIIIHHGVARTHAERDKDWTESIKNLCINGQDNMFTHRLPYNTMFISLSKFCTEEFMRHYGEEYAKFKSVLLQTPIEHRISTKWKLKKNKSGKYRFENEFNLNDRNKDNKPKILGDWSTINKGSQIIPVLKEILKDEFEFVQLKTPHITDTEQHRLNVEKFYKDSQIYLNLSTSEGYSFAIADGLAYGLLCIGTNVGIMYETPNNVACSFDWKERTNIEFIVDKIRKCWKNREQYNPVPWLKENFDWDTWKNKITYTIDSFYSSINNNIISFPITRLNMQHFMWQFPVITEKYCLEKVIALNEINRLNYIYVGIPYATLIDKHIMPNNEIISIALQIKEMKSKNSSVKVISACQHIHYEKILPIVKLLGITDLYISHKLKEQERIDKINIHGLPLYPVNIFDKTRCIGIESGPRKYLFSFIGAHMNHYINPIRKRILSWPASKNETYYIQDTGIWHFEKDVYQLQVRGMNISTADKDVQKIQNMIYNEVLSQSIFSLCPIGAGPNTIRLWESICLGSIPVIIADEFNVENFIPKMFGKFYVELKYDSNELMSPAHLEKYLNEITQDEINGMRQKCYEVGKYLETTFIDLSSFETTS